MRKRLKNIFRLGVKELNSLCAIRPAVPDFLHLYVRDLHGCDGVQTELRNASIAVVDEDHSDLSRQIRAAFLKPYFQVPGVLPIHQIDPAMDAGRYAFVIDIPVNFQSDVLAGHQPQVQAERRRNRHDAGRQWRCLYPDDHHQSALRVPKPVGPDASTTGYRDDAHGV